MSSTTSTQTYTGPAESPLCRNCRSGLDFDDKAAGGYKAVSEDGGPEHLLMPEMLKYEHETAVPSVWWYHPKVEEDEPLPVSWHLCRDSGPGFPALERSARGPRGCGFCGLVRARLLAVLAAGKKKLRKIIASSPDGAVSIDFSSFYWNGDRLGPGAGRVRGDLCLFVVISPANKKPRQQAPPAPSEASRFEPQPVSDLALTFRLDCCKSEGGAESVNQWLRLRPLFSGPGRFTPEAARWAKEQIRKPPELLTPNDLRFPNLFRPEYELVTYLPPEGHFCPKRLIDVQSDPPRLVLRSDVPSKSPAYSALSYCWGSAEDIKAQLKTTKDTIYERMDGIYDHQMTAALKDAIAVTRALSIPYLWIDALCVVQGSEGVHDWEEQSPEMHLIYGHASVTLGALASDSCRKSFLDPPQDEADVHVRWRSRVSPGVSGIFRVTYIKCQKIGRLNRPHDQKHSSLEFLKAEMADAVWPKRGWTFLEGAVSPRFLAFTKSALVFSNPRRDYMMGVDWPLIKVSWSNSINSAFEWRGVTWTLLSQGYSGRMGGFTRPTDFLPAISGLAAYTAKYKSLGPEHYLAGLWKRTLSYDLAWSTNSPQQTDLATLVRQLSNQNPYICPTWSYGIHGHVGWSLATTHYPVCRMEAVGLRPKGANAFGEVLPGGRLRITSRVVPLPSDLRVVAEDSWGKKKWFWKTEAEEADAGGSWHWHLDWEPNRDEVVPRGELMIVATGTRRAHELTLTGLIIHPAEDAEPGVYVRVGSFSRIPNSKPIPWSEHLPVPFFGRTAHRTIDII